MRRRLSIVILYAAFGPPVGATLLFIVGMIYALATSASILASEFSADPLKYLAGLVVNYFSFLAAGFIFGGAQALATGVGLAVISSPPGKFTYRAAFIVPLIVGALAVFPILKIVDRELSDIVLNDFSIPAAMGSLGVAASLILRFLFRDQFSPARSKE